MAYYFDKQQLATNSGMRAQYAGLNELRRQHEMIQQANNAKMGQMVVANQAALIPTDAYRELENITKRVYTNDEGQGYMNDLLPIARSLHIGKTVALYRQASDKSGRVDRSMSGKVPEAMSKTSYSFEGDPVPIFTTGYGREWREHESFSSENFDEMADDQFNASRDIKEDQAVYMLWGDTSIKTRGYTGYGIATHPSTQKLNLGASGANINLTTATPDESVAYFTGAFANALDNNYCPEVDVLWVSPQIRRNFQKPYSNAAGFKEGTVEDYLVRYGRIKAIKTTFELGRTGQGTGDYNVDGQGNEFFAYVRNESVIQPLVGAAVSTIAVPRSLPMDDHNYLLWGAMGLRVKADENGRSQVFYASEIS